MHKNRSAVCAAEQGVRGSMKFFFIIFVIILGGCDSKVSKVPLLPDWPDAFHAYESLGRDGMHCYKVRITNKEWLRLIASLELKSISTYPSYDTSSANCNESWWGVDFPIEAEYYWLSNNGATRRLAALKNGVLFFTHEFR
jgi:hypothetical protein